MSKYKVILDVILMEDHYDIDADSEAEAIEKAMSQSNYERGTLTVFEVEEII